MSEKYLEFDNLLKGFVEGTLTREQQSRMEQLLQNDSEARNRYLDYMEVEAMLSTHKVKIKHTKITRPKTVKRRSLKVRKTQVGSRRYKTKSGMLLLTAAALFLVSGLIYYFKIFKSETAFATIVKLTGNVSVINSEKSEKAVKGLKISFDTELICNQGSNSVDLETADGSIYTISGNSKVKFSREDNCTKIDLLSGFIKAHVKKQPFSKPVIISTPKANMTVLGTVFRVSLDDTSATLIVDEGSVEIKNNKNKKIIIKENEMAVALAGEIKTRSIAKFKVKKLEILNAEYGAGDKWFNVTSLLKDRANNSRLIITGSFVSLAGDPVFKTPKTLKVKYRINGMEGAAAFYEYLTDKISPGNFRKEIILSKLL